MLDTKKLLYILPDVTYVAELLPTKKEHTFSVHSFRQINGEFLNDDDLIPENVEKLFSKLEADEYHVVLPDFLFTNTVIEVQDTSEAKVKAYLKEKLLPTLGLSKDTHEFETTILTQYGGKSKVQLSALEKAVMNPLIVSGKAHQIKISAVSPLSWTIKSVISLEPSISVIQVGSLLYVAQHYIGVDQTTMAKVDEIENVGETIKTLKGAEPSIQTVYLLTNGLVEDKLKHLVSSTLPIQQLTSSKDEDSQMPSYVKQIIESGMKTLDISDYPVPNFEMPASPVAAAEGSSEPDDEDTAVPAVTKPEPVKEEKPAPKPDAEEPEDTDDEKEDDEADDTAAAVPPMPLNPPAPPVVMADDLDSDLDDDNDEDTVEPLTPPSLKAPAATAAVLNAAPLATAAAASTVSPKVMSESLDDVSPVANVKPIEPKISDPEITTAEPNISQFGPRKDIETETEIVDEPETTLPTAAAATSTSATVLPPKPMPTVIKNKSGNGSMLKMIGITLAVFAITVAVGVGIGLGVLKVTNRGGAEPSPSPTAAATPTPAVTTSPTPAATSSATTSTIDPETISVLIVNATTKAGYAGTTKSKLDTAGYERVTAANAKGEYDPGTYVLMKTQNAALIAQLESDTDLELEFDDTIATEDPRAEYDAVIVLAE